MKAYAAMFGVAALIGAATMLSGCASFDQGSNEVWLRRRGGRLQNWATLAAASKAHVAYAWASVSAYQDDKRPCGSPQDFLRTQGWTQWDNLPLLPDEQPSLKARFADLAREMRQEHLRVVVWSRPPGEGRGGEVVVAFGGTVPSNLRDWKANLHWAGTLFGARDQYELISTGFVPAFVEEFKSRQATPEWSWLSSARIVPTGHSLGGGLAQRFAYDVWDQLALPEEVRPDARRNLRVPMVVTFDPSPVSGKRSSPAFQAHRNEDRRYKGLEIHRIYNRGEILATVRSILHFGNPDPDQNEQGQNWIDIRYKDNWSWKTLLPDGWVHAHGLQSLACLMAQAAGASVAGAEQAGSAVLPAH